MGVHDRQSDVSELLGQISPNAESEDTVSRLVDAVPLLSSARILGSGLEGAYGLGSNC